MKQNNMKDPVITFGKKKKTNKQTKNKNKKNIKTKI